MGKVILIVLLTPLASVIASQMTGFIVGGHNATINSYAHSAFLAIECVTEAGPMICGCGSSIINQGILLTAAHCFEACVRSTKVVVHVGDANKEKGMVRFGKAYKVHENYDVRTVTNDVALIRLKGNLVLEKSIQRVVLMPQPPYYEEASIAGWGLTDENRNKRTLLLKDLTKLHVTSRDGCKKTLKRMPMGTFCAGVKKSPDYVARGDSGSALVVRKFIQIGLVSFKVPSISRSLIIYTDVGYFYNWIHSNAELMFCKIRDKE